MKPGMSKRGLRGASLDQLEKNLAEAFAILDSMGASNNVSDAQSPIYVRFTLELSCKVQVLSKKIDHTSGLT